MKNRDEGQEESLAKQRLALAYLHHHGRTAKKAHHLVRHLALGTVLALLLVVSTWIGGNLYGTRFSLQGKSISAHTSDEQLLQMVQDKARTYRLTIVQPDGKQQAFSLQDMGMQVQAENSVAAARNQQHTWSSRLQWWRPVQLKVALDTHTAAFNTFVSQHATITIEPARDASLALVDGVPQLTDGANGKQYGLENPTQNIAAAASGLQTAPLHMRLVVQQPTVTAKSLSTAKSKLENVLKQPVTFTIDGDQIKPDTKELAGWIILTPDQKTKDVAMSVNTDKVSAYVNKIASDHSHPPRAQVSLGDGGTIPGSTGVTVTNKDTAVAAVAAQLLSGKDLKIDLPVSRTSFKTVNASGTGKWIEVDLTNKRMYAYQDTSLVRTFLVSAGAAKTPTVTGTFSIYSKMTKKTMTGPNADGTRYVQPNVPWVNFFYKDYAIHGNYWRPNSYFGNINSSHGCVGVTPGEGAWVYNWAPVGTTVVVHT